MPTGKKGKQPHIAVIGSGYWGKNLIRSHHQLGALRLICDKSATVLDTFREQYPDVETCAALDELLGRDDIRAVVVATPAETHYPIARACLLAGKHVYVEKPLVLDEAHGRELIELASRNERVLMVGHLLQYHPVFIRLKELVRGGDLGRINYIYSNRLNLGKIRREENILWSFAPHDISMILALAGEYPERVRATGGYYLHRKIADVTTTHLTFSSGLQAHVFVSWLHPFKEQKLVVVGEKKMAVFDDTRPWEDKLLLYGHRIDWRDHLPVPHRADAERVAVDPNEPLKQECLHFLQCVATGNRPLTDGSEGLAVLRVLKRAQACLDNGGESVVAGPAAAIAPHSPTPTGNGYFSHPTAEIDAGATIGAGTKIWHFSHVLSGSTVGERCNIGQNVVIGPDAVVGNGCKIQNNVSVFKGVTLEDGVFCGPSMVFTNIYNPRAEIGRMDQVRPTRVRRGATLGANCTIVCGATIGEYAFVGAGAVVNRSIPAHALVVGNPARPIGWVCACGERLTDALDCLACGKRYADGENGLSERGEEAKPRQAAGLSRDPREAVPAMQ